MKANLADINNAEAAGAITAHVRNISYKIMEKEFKEIINKLPENKAPGLNNIINKVLRIVTLIISKELAQAIINYLAIGLPDGLKKLFTFVLRKEGKKNYLLPGAY